LKDFGIGLIVSGRIIHEPGNSKRNQAQPAVRADWGVIELFGRRFLYQKREAGSAMSLLFAKCVTSARQ
jgi:hypothetical protein